jgi:acyl carrier protein
MLMPQPPFGPGIAESIIFARIDEFAHRSSRSENAVARSDDPDLLRLSVADFSGVSQLIDFVEKEFGVAVSERQLGDEKLESLRDLAHFVATNQPFAVG